MGGIAAPILTVIRAFYTVIPVISHVIPAKAGIHSGADAVGIPAAEASAGGSQYSLLSLLSENRQGAGGSQYSLLTALSSL